jgi:epoxyqueuosine reductase
MGNRGDAGYVAPLASALVDEEAIVRGHAAWALGRIGGSAAEWALRRALVTEPAPPVRSELLAALARPQRLANAGDGGVRPGTLGPSFG